MESKEYIESKEYNSLCTFLINKLCGNFIRVPVLKNTNNEVNKVYNQFYTGLFINNTNKEQKELNILTGVKIKSLNTGKLKSLGLKEGMIILKINNETVESVEQVTTKLNNSNRGILLEIITESGKREFVGFGL